MKLTTNLKASSLPASYLLLSKGLSSSVIFKAQLNTKGIARSLIYSILLTSVNISINGYISDG